MVIARKTGHEVYKKQPIATIVYLFGLKKLTVNTEPHLQHTDPHLELEAALDDQLPMVVVFGDDDCGKKTMISAALGLALSELGRKVLFCYFDEAGVMHCKASSSASVDLVVMVAPRTFEHAFIRHFRLARLRLLLIHDLPFGISNAFTELKNACRCHQDHLDFKNVMVKISGDDDSEDGFDHYMQLVELASINQLACELCYLGEVTVDEHILKEANVPMFADQSVLAFKHIAKQVLSLIR